MTDHTHDDMSGMEALVAQSQNGQEQQNEEPTLTLPPADVWIEQLQSKVAELTIENFQLRSAAEFQARLANGFKTQMIDLSNQLSECKGKDEDQKDASPKPRGKRSVRST